MRAAAAAALLAALAAAPAAALDHQVNWSFSSGGDKLVAAPGDTLTFSWSGFHNVAGGPDAGEKAFEACDKAAFPKLDGGDTPGYVYKIAPDLPGGSKLRFICEVGSHCEQGMKLEVTIEAAAPKPEPEPMPTPWPAPGPTPGPAPSPGKEVCKGDDLNVPDSYTAKSYARRTAIYLACPGDCYDGEGGNEAGLPDCKDGEMPYGKACATEACTAAMADWDNEADSQCMVDLDATGNTKLDQMKQWVPFLKSLCDKAAGGCMQRLIELDSEMMKKKAESCGLPVDCNVCGEYVAFSNSFVKDCGKDEAISMMMPPSDAAVMWAALEQIEIGYGLMCKAKPGVGPAKPPGADKPGEEKVDKEVKKEMKEIGRSYGSKAGAEAKQDSGAAGRGAALAGALLGFVVVLL